MDSSVDKPYTVKPLKRSPSLKNSDSLSSNRHYFTLHQTLGRNHPDPPSRNSAISWPNQEKDDADQEDEIRIQIREKVVSIVMLDPQPSEHDRIVKPVIFRLR